MPGASIQTKRRRERRRHKRTHVLLSGRLLSGERATKGVVLDLSAAGARIRLAEPPILKPAATLRLARGIDLPVEVAWVKDNTLGLAFREAPAKIASLFAGVLPEAATA